MSEEWTASSGTHTRNIARRFHLLSSVYVFLLCVLRQGVGEAAHFVAQAGFELIWNSGWPTQLAKCHLLESHRCVSPMSV